MGLSRDLGIGVCGEGGLFLEVVDLLSFWLVFPRYWAWSIVHQVQLFLLMVYFQSWRIELGVVVVLRRVKDGLKVV